MSEALKDARTITGSLKRSKRAIEYGVLQADSALTTLLKDKDVIDKTLHTQKYYLKNELKSSENRLKRIKTVQIIEKYSLTFSVFFFLSVVFYIVAKRTRLLMLSHLIYKFVNSPMRNDLKNVEYSSSYQNYNVKEMEVLTNEKTQNGKCNSDVDKFIYNLEENEIISSSDNQFKYSSEYDSVIKSNNKNNNLVNENTNLSTNDEF